MVDNKPPNSALAHILCGVDNRESFKNFSLIANQSRGTNILNATTLLVPHYVDHHEVRKIAEFIADLDRDIPYSLLIFHPDYYLNDLPVTPRRQVAACYDEARKYLRNVHLGNKHLLI